jgi:hypothetical protein
MARNLHSFAGPSDFKRAAMISVENRWEILEKSRTLLSSSKLLLQRLSGRFQESATKNERQATDLDSNSPTLSKSLSSDFDKG